RSSACGRNPEERREADGEREITFHLELAEEIAERRARASGDDLQEVGGVEADRDARLDVEVSPGAAAAAIDDDDVAIVAAVFPAGDLPGDRRLLVRGAVLVEIIREAAE